MKLWDKGQETLQQVHEFTVGNDRILDKALAPYDVVGSIAHAKMLHEIGVLNDQETKELILELENIKLKTLQNDFEIPVNFEDIHSYVESILIDKLGETGKKIHTGRSRNDQVLVDLHLYTKDQIKEIKSLTVSLAEQLLKLSDEHKEVLIPGYTHLQVAMPSSFGLWFGAYAESLVDDLIFLNAAYKIADQNPLGSAAGYGSSFPLNRELTTEILQFHSLKVNSVAAQMSRGKLEKSTAFSISSLAGTLSKFSMDICLYMNQNFGFLTFPDQLTTGSSIMPHKKNPDVFELIRGKCNKLQALPTELTLITNNLPSGYHRDLQLLKESFLPAIESIKDCLKMTQLMLDHIVIKQDILDDEKYNYLYSVENVNSLVQEGKSFREAYQKVGKDIEKDTYIPNKSIKHIHTGSIGNLGNDMILEKLIKEN